MTTVPPARLGTAIATSTPDAIYVRGHDLVGELLGSIDFTSMVFLHLRGRRPTDAERTVLDSVLVTVMEHGLTPSSITARLIHASSPDAMQGAVAAGLLGAGSAFLGSMEEAARILQEGAVAVRAGETTAREYCAAEIAGRLEEGRPVPGFGHHIHRPDDPRSPRLLEIAREAGAPTEHAELLATLSAVFDEMKGRHVTVNATGAIAAVLSDIGFDWRIVRGFSLIGRAAGLVGHVAEELERPIGMEIWGLVDAGVPYDGARPPARPGTTDERTTG